MEKHYKTDLIFIVVTTEEKRMIPASIDIDIEVKIDDTKVRLCFDDKYIEGDISNMTELIYDILR